MVSNEDWKHCYECIWLSDMKKDVFRYCPVIENWVYPNSLTCPKGQTKDDVF